MKYITFIVAFLASTLWAQLQPVIPFSDVETFIDIEFLNPSTGFVVGNDLELYKTLDSGKTFTHIPVPGNTGVADVHITKSGITFLCGDGGLVSYSRDMGNNWTNISLATFPESKLRFIESLSPTMIVVAGENGFFAKSNDLGLSWFSSTTGVSKVNRVVFRDHNRAFALMDYGALSHTTDGGMTWKPYFTSYFTTGFKYFFDLNGTWVFVVENGSLIISSDQGKTFTSLFASENYSIIGAWRTISNRVQFMSSSGRVFVYPWNPSSTMTFPARTYRGVWASGSVVYATCDGPDIIRTSNNGSTYQNSFISFGDKPIQSLVINSELDWIISGNPLQGTAGMIARTTNGGASWKSVFEGEWVNNCYFINSTEGFRVRMRKLDYSNNSGSTWSTLLTRTSGVIISEQSFNINDGFFIETDSLSKPRNLSYSKLFKRVSATATQQLNLVGSRLTQLKFISLQNGWVLKDSTRFYVTKNAGSGWTLQPVVTPFISSYERQGDSSGVLVTQTGRIMQTADNAASWQTIFHDSSVVFQSVTALGSNIIAAGDSGAFFLSRDNGTTWLRKTSNTKYHFSHVEFIDTNLFIVTTKKGGIFKGDLSGSLIAIGGEPKDEILPSTFLTGNYPNPFNSSTIIEFNTPEGGITGLTVYDVTGRVVHSEVITATKGKNSFRFEGNGLHSGVYFYVLDFGGKREYSKMILLK